MFFNRICPEKNSIVIEAMLFIFLSFVTHTAHTEKADDKAKIETKTNCRHHKHKTYLHQI